MSFVWFGQLDEGLGLYLLHVSRSCFGRPWAVSCLVLIKRAAGGVVAWYGCRIGLWHRLGVLYGGHGESNASGDVEGEAEQWLGGGRGYMEAPRLMGIAR